MGAILRIQKYFLDLPIFLLAFLFVFAVSFNGIPNFSYIGVFLIPVLLFFYPKLDLRLKFIKILLKDKLFIRVVFSYFFVLLATVCYSVFRGSYDFGFSKPILHSLVSIPACMFIAAYLYSLNKNEGSFFSPVYVFLRNILYLQSFIIVVMLFLPEVGLLINSITRSDAQLERMLVYGGGRGLGLSGSIAFGLAVTMAVLVFFVFYMKSVIKDNKFSVLDYFIFIVVAGASLSAGRTAIAGILLFIAYYIFVNIIGNKWGRLAKFILLAPVFVFITALLIVEVEIQSISRYVGYVFQPIQNYIDYGNFRVSSVEGLINMYFVPDNKTLLVGDALYMSSSGTGYYMSTDAGFMRVLLFFGLPLSLAFYLLWVFVFYSSCSYFKRLMPHAFLFFSIVLFISFIFQYKGEFIFVAVSVNKILFIYLFYFILVKKEFSSI